MPDILVIDKLTKWFGNLAAVNDLSFNVEQGEILGMMGPNGAGKTTVFNLITGVYPPYSREGHLPGQRCHPSLGVAPVSTGDRPDLPDSAPLRKHDRSGKPAGGSGVRRSVERERRLALSAQRFLTSPGSAPKKDLFAGKLMLLDRKRLELARGLATKPSLLLIDEVAAGLTEGEVERLLEIVKAIQRKGVTIIWVEHILMMMNKGVDRLLVISGGQSLMCGDPRECMESKEVQEVYLGAEEA